MGLNGLTRRDKLRMDERPAHTTRLWHPDMKHQVYVLSLAGLSNRELAEFFKVKLSCIEDWSRNNVDFIDARAEGTAKASGKVAESLYKLAVGYDYVEKVVIKNRAGEVTRTEIYRKHKAGDVQACIKWLQSKRRDDWTDVQRSQHTVLYSGVVDVRYIAEQLHDRTQFTEAELEMMLKMGLAQIEDAEAEDLNEN